MKKSYVSKPSWIKVFFILKKSKTKKQELNALIKKNDKDKYINLFNTYNE